MVSNENSSSLCDIESDEQRVDRGAQSAARRIAAAAAAAREPPPQTAEIPSIISFQFFSTISFLFIILFSRSQPLPHDLRNVANRQTTALVNIKYLQVCLLIRFQFRFHQNNQMVMLIIFCRVLFFKKHLRIRNSIGETSAQNASRDAREEIPNRIERKNTNSELTFFIFYFIYSS